MKRHYSDDRGKRFGGSLRHYHRTAGQQRRSWDDWVYADAPRPFQGMKYLKILGVVLSIVLLGGIIAGLYIEMQ
jgi:hypothetical protein